MHSIPKRLAAMLGGFVLVFMLTTPTPVHADEWELGTVFSLDHSFQVPGKILEANTPYLIKLLVFPGNHDVIQIFDKDRTKLLTTFMSIPETREEVTDHTVFEFMEVPAGNPVPIRSWFYPGRLTGREFLYPKEQMAQIAAYTAQPVQTALTIQEPLEHGVTDTAALIQNEPQVNSENNEVTKGEVTIERSKPTEPEIVNVEPAAPPEITPEPANVEVTPPPAPEVEGNTNTELPHTASPVSLLGLLGLLSFGVGFGTRAVVNHRG